METDKSLPKLWCGAVSRNVVEAVCRLDNQDMPLGLIPSPRQVGSRGYAFSPHQFREVVRELNGRIPICRDHGGPEQGEWDWQSALLTDSAYMQGIHVDPWLTRLTINHGVVFTANIISTLIDQGFRGWFEIGTEEAIFPMTTAQFKDLLASLKLRLQEDFALVKYVVVQAGTRLEGNHNVGNRNLSQFHEMVEICKEFNVLPKEHNGDYQTPETLRSKFASGLAAVNIAPELAMWESQFLWEVVTEETRSRWVKYTTQNAPWAKWFPMGTALNTIEDFDLVSVAGHYVYGEFPEFEEWREDIQNHLRDKLVALGEVIYGRD